MNEQRKVPFFNYQGIFEHRREEYLKTIEDVLSRGAFILQRDGKEFETNVAEYLQVKHAIGVANCTDGLTLALQAVGVKAGDEVIFPSHTFVATAASAKAIGAVPVPVDCGKDHLIDPQSIKKAITSKTKVIMPVQLNGRTSRMDEIQAIADQHRLLVVEDAAQAFGSTYKGRHAGTFGLAAAFSFYPAKTLGCFGDGGIVVTNDDHVAETVTLLRDHGRNKEGEIVQWGMNSRLDNLQAALLNVNLKYYKESIHRRREIAACYHEELGGLSELTLPPAPGSEKDHYDIFQNYEIEADRRDDLRSFLQSKGVGTLIQWGGKAVHQLKALQFTQKLPATDRLFERALMLPMHAVLSNEDVHYVCQQVKAFYRA
ncbi:MAG: cell wall biogenesis protein [Deltaproteobacteria bacterium RIFCSPLOWO2_02_FULL_44_10]|nr:MAG: cell wall biogenesis protein [Deltaproteobacteria bacterium RIFCSPHIGHO2_02_FULL_44_16]OGQ46000.1 MAG: cell wall biogenesis protein [Deltaproteobacteria bacterium RIFCSPLOWO2_02_FULL_44_10]